VDCPLDVLALKDRWDLVVLQQFRMTAFQHLPAIDVLLDDIRHPEDRGEREDHLGVPRRQSESKGFNDLRATKVLVKPHANVQPVGTQ
jgi:hypothetical protein